MGLFEFVIGELIFWWRHNTNPDYEVHFCITKFFSRRIKQSDCSFHNKLNYNVLNKNKTIVYTITIYL